MKTSPRLILLYAVLGTLLIGAMVLYGQEKPKYQPTEVQSLRLQVRQKDALLAKERLEALQAAVQTQQKTFQDALKALTDESDVVKKEQGWPKETVFEPNNLTFTEPAKDAKK